MSTLTQAEMGLAMPMQQATPAAQPMPAVSAKANAPGAAASVVWGIAGLIVAGLIFGGFAIVNASKAKAATAKEPGRFQGDGLATAGLVLGVVDIVGAVIGFFVLMAM